MFTNIAYRYNKDKNDTKVDFYIKKRSNRIYNSTISSLLNIHIESLRHHPYLENDERDKVSKEKKETPILWYSPI